MENKNLLMIVIVLLFGIFTVLVIDLNEQTPEEQMADSVNKAVNEVSNSIAEKIEQNICSAMFSYVSVF